MITNQKWLFIEDNPDDALLVFEQVKAVARGRVLLIWVQRVSDAIEALSAQRFSLILVGLPNMLGLPTLARVHAAAPTIPMVVMGGKNDESEALRGGARDYLVKGQVDGYHLLRTAQYAIERQATEQSIKQYADIVDHLQLGVCVFVADEGPPEPKLSLVMANHVAARMTSLPIDSDPTVPLADFFRRLRRCDLESVVWAVLRTGQPADFECDLVDDAERITNTHAVKAFPLLDCCVGLAIEDTTERVRAAAALRIQENRYRLLADNASDLVTLSRDDGSFIYFSPSCVRALACPPASLTNASIYEFLHPADIAGFTAAVRETMANGLVGDLECRFRTHWGAYVWYEARITRVEGEGGELQFLVSSRDVSQRKEYEEQLSYSTLHDSLTGLPNRVVALDRLEYALRRFQQTGRQVAVLHMDIDRFKLVNDSLGQQAGDQLLAVLAGRLASCCRSTDTPTRLGGDEFAIVMEDLAGIDAAVAVAERIKQALTAPFDLGGHEVYVTASIGIAMSDEGSQSAEELLRSATAALRRARVSGNAQMEIFDPTMNARAVERLDLEADLRRGIQRGEFLLYYQPLLSVAAGQLQGFEALMRWQHPRRGLVFPGDFIPLAEETGLIVQLGMWALREACRQAREWELAHPSTRPITMAVNLSGRQFQQTDLAEQVAAILAETGLDGSRLELEITETVLMHDVEPTVAALRKLKALGVRIAVDDFATGFSSLSYLRRFPVDTLKVDRSFVMGLETDAESLAIVRAVVMLAKALNLGTTAEGIESEGQLRMIGDLGCDYAQGYLFARPMPAAGAEAQLVAALG